MCPIEEPRADCRNVTPRDGAFLGAAQSGPEGVSVFRGALPTNVTNTYRLFRLQLQAQ